MKARLTLLAFTFVGLACTASSSSNPPAKGPGQRTVSTLDSKGGTITLEGVATVVFPAGALAAATEVTLETTADAATAALFEESTVIFELTNRVPYEVRLRTGGATLTAPVQVSLRVPSTITGTARALAEVVEASEEDDFVQFEVLDAARSGDSLSFSLPHELITNAIRPDGAHEAVLTLAEGPGIPGVPGFPTVGGPTGGAGECPVKPFYPPLAKNEVTSPFNPGRSIVVQGRTATGHYGTDYRAANGADLFAAGDGVVLKSYVSTTLGECVILKVDGVGSVLYAHMKTRAVQTGDKVTCGQVIGQADHTGRSQAPHLHLELAPNGALFGSANKVDSAGCLDPNACDGCRFTKDYVGTARITYSQPFNAAINDADEHEEVNAMGVLLTPGEGGALYVKTATINVTKTRTLHPTPAPDCTITTTGSASITAGTPIDPVRGVLRCLPPGIFTDPADKTIYFDTLQPFTIPMEKTFSGCGTSGKEDAGASWLLIPSILAGPPGHSTTADKATLSGTFVTPPNSKGGTTTHEWSFTRVN